MYVCRHCELMDTCVCVHAYVCELTKHSSIVESWLRTPSLTQETTTKTFLKCTVFPGALLIVQPSLELLLRMEEIHNFHLIENPCFHVITKGRALAVQSFHGYLPDT